MFFGIFKNIRRLLYLILALIVLYLVFKKNDFKFFGTDTQTYTVIRVVDGDTFILNNKERVRLIGVDTPEKYISNKLYRDIERTKKDKETLQSLGKQASEFVRKLVQGKKVTLQKDKYSSDRDKYNRLLRYVYLEDGTCINAKIIESGYANAYTQFKFEKEDEFRRLEREARENNRGLWKEELN